MVVCMKTYRIAAEGREVGMLQESGVLEPPTLKGKSISCNSLLIFRM